MVHNSAVFLSGFVCVRDALTHCVARIVCLAPRTSGREPERLVWRWGAERWSAGDGWRRVCADPRGERVPAGAGLARLAGGRGAGGGAAQADGAVQALLALVQRGVRAARAGAARPGRGAPVQPQPHRDRRVTVAPRAPATKPLIVN